MYCYMIHHTPLPVKKDDFIMSKTTLYPSIYLFLKKFNLLAIKDVPLLYVFMLFGRNYPTSFLFVFFYSFIVFIVFKSYRKSFFRIFDKFMIIDDENQIIFLIK